MRRCETRISASNTTSAAPGKSAIHRPRLDGRARRAPQAINAPAQNAAVKRKRNGNANNLSANNRNACDKRKRNWNANRLSAKGKSAPSRNARKRNMSA